MDLRINSQAPDFSLKNQDGKIVRLSDFQGQWLLVYFYPKDDTPGCTKEALAMQKHLQDFKKTGLHVVGISIDSEKSHKKFAEKYGLGFDLLADESKEVVQACGVWGKKKFMGREYMGTNRSSFLVDPQGVIVKIYPKVKPEDHASEVLNDVKLLMSEVKS